MRRSRAVLQIRGPSAVFLGFTLKSVTGLSDNGATYNQIIVLIHVYAYVTDTHLRADPEFGIVAVCRHKSKGLEGTAGD